MKLQATRLLLGLGAALLAGGLQAQTYAMRAQVPFAFQVPGRDLPAGQYKVEAAVHSKIPTLIQTSTGRSIFLQSGQPWAASKPEGKLVFHRYGNRFFLAEIWSFGGTCTAVSKTPAEKEILRGEGPKEMALVYVAADRGE